MLRPTRSFFIAVVAFLPLLGPSLLFAVTGYTKGRAVAPFTPQFKPSDYVWHPEVSPAGPVVVHRGQQIESHQHDKARPAFSGKTGESETGSEGFAWPPEEPPTGPVSIIVRGAD